MANASQRQQQVTQTFAKVIAETTGVSAGQASRLATDLIAGAPGEPVVAGARESRLARLRRRLIAIPIVQKLGQYLKRVIYLPWSFHKFQATFIEMQHTLRMIVQEQHREMRDLIDRRNNETRRVITQEIEDLRGMIREQNQPSDADAFRDRRDAA
jgi:hypothetical protein